jgi:transcriptional regulator with XRE-family HTH domain
MPDSVAKVVSPPASLQRALGAKLSTARQSAGLTQVEAARRLGVPQSMIAKVELGQRKLLFVEALEFARLYGIHPVDLDPR